MINFAIFDQATGRCLQTCFATDLAHAMTAAAPGQVAVEVEAAFSGADAYLESGTVQYRSPAPSAHHTFDWDTKQWQDLRTLGDLKALKNDEINAARLHANQTSFWHGGKEVACDALSRSDIDATNGYVGLYGALPDSWPGGWKARDNSYLPIADVAAWKAFFSSMFAQGNANFARAQQLKAQLALATTLEQIAAITWEANA